MYKFILPFWVISISILSVSAQIKQPAVIEIKAITGSGEDWVQGTNAALDGGFILSLSTNSKSGVVSSICSPNNLAKTIFQKFDATGSLLEWQKCYPSNGDSSFSYIFKLANGDFVLGGAKLLGTPPGYQDIVARREDANGNIIWSRRMGGSSTEYLRGMLPTHDGGFVMMTRSYSNDGDVGFHYGGLSGDIWVVKIDTGGNIVWSKVIGGTEDENPKGICPAPDGGFYIIGYTASNDYDCTGLHYPGQYYDAYLARLDSNGNILWHRNIGSEKGGGGLAITADNRGGVYIAALANASGNDATNYFGSNDFWVLRVDSSNNILFSKCYGSTSGNETPAAICLGTDNTVWVSGFCGDNKEDQVDAPASASANSGKNGWVINIDTSGNLIKAKVLGASKSDDATFLQPLSNGVVLTGGTYEAPGAIGSGFPTVFEGGLYDMYLAKLAPWTTYISQIYPIENNTIKCFPNPAVNSFTVQNITLNISKLKITDVTGKIIFYQTINTNSYMVDVSNWSRGLYFVEVQSAENISALRKIVVQ